MDAPREGYTTKIARGEWCRWSYTIFGGDVLELWVVYLCRLKIWDVLWWNMYFVQVTVMMIIFHVCSWNQSLQILCNIYIYIMHFILILYTYSRKSKDQTLPLNRRESFTWIIRKTILLFGRLDFLGRNIYIYIYIHRGKDQKLSRI